MNITYKVSPTFAKIHRDASSFIFVMGPVGSGKSSGCIWHLLMNAAKQTPDENGVRHSRYAVIRATYPQLRSSTIKTFIEWFKHKIELVYSTPITGKLIYDLDDGTKLNMELMFIAVDDEASAERLRSWEFTGAWVNEAHEVPRYLITILSERTNRYPSSRNGGAIEPQILFDYNAVSTEHWLYKIAEEEKPEGCSFYRQPPAVIKDTRGVYRINPEAENLDNLATTYYENILKIATPEQIATDLMNNYGERKAGKPVYKDYSDEDHLSPTPLKPIRGLPVIIGIDQGLTPAAAFTQVSPDGTVIVFDEITTVDCSLQEFAEEMLIPYIMAKYPYIKDNYVCVCDPATTQRSQNDAKSGIDILRDCGLNVRTAKTNVPTDRREAVTHYLRLKRKFQLSPTCQALRKGFISEYKYDEARTLSGVMYKEKPSKNEYSHIHDALQYAMLEYFFQKRRKKFKKVASNYKAASSIGGY